jgi:hypothetical protein
MLMPPFILTADDVANVLRRLNEPNEPKVAEALLGRLDTGAVQKAAEQGDAADPFDGVRRAYDEVAHQLREGGLVPVSEV